MSIEWGALFTGLILLSIPALLIVGITQMARWVKECSGRIAGGATSFGLMMAGIGILAMVIFLLLYSWSIGCVGMDLSEYPGCNFVRESP